jgi:hypothetical protein
MPDLIQIGSYTVIEQPNFAEALARVRRQLARSPRTKRAKKDPFLPVICDDPQARFKKCRAVKGTGVPCDKDRPVNDFFCGMHNIEKRLPDVRIKSLNRIKEILAHIKFRGWIVKFGLCYEFRFREDQTDYVSIKHEEIRNVDDATIRQWITAAMRAEDQVYMGIKCIYCRTAFRQVDRTGTICDKCFPAAVCNDCWGKHSNLPSHKNAVRLSREQLFRGIETDLKKDTEPKPLSNDEHMDWVEEFMDDNPDLLEEE